MVPNGHDRTPPSNTTTLDAQDRSERNGPIRHDAPDGDAQLGRRIGPYRIERLIARGGMGRVYLAVREDDYAHRVALKLVDRGPENLALLDRFIQERQILARLEHANIARIFDGGTTAEALPYFVMEYIEGEPIDRYCETRGFDLRQRLEPFLQICHVVHFAHQNLVVHRDLKPGNILITPDGTPKLLDFGIAKPLDPEAENPEVPHGLPPLTPAYASPEQLLGQPVTTASDIYSLGVVLYHLLAGRGPYTLSGASSRQMIRRVCGGDPPPPSTVAVSKGGHRITAELDAIVAKAMHKKSEQRYASATQLAEDIERHLANLPVEAYPGGWRHRAAKYARRHKTQIVIVLVIAVFALTVTFLWRRAVGEEKLAQQAHADAEAAHVRTKTALQRSERVSLYLEELLEAADPYAGNLTVRQVLDQGREKLATGLAEEPEIRAELLTTLGTIYNNLSLYDEARELKEEALRTRLAADPADRPELATDLNNLGRLDYDLGDYATAERHFRDALAMWRRLGAEEETLLGLRNLAATLTQTGRHDEALGLHHEILDTVRRLTGEDSVEVARSLHSLAVLHRTRGQPAVAEPLLRRALEIYSELLGPEHTRSASVLATLGRVLHALEQTGEARQSFEHALAIRLELLGEDHVLVANTRKNLAALLLDLGETERAGELLEKSLAVLRQAKPEDDWTVADAESLWGRYLVALGRYAEGEPLLIGGYERIRHAKGDADIATRQARQRIVALYEQWGDNAKGAAFAQAAPLVEDSSAPRRP